MNCLLCCCSTFVADAARWHCMDVLAADSVSNTHHKQSGSNIRLALKEQLKCNLLREKKREREICQTQSLYTLIFISSLSLSQESRLFSSCLF